MTKQKVACATVFVLIFSISSINLLYAETKNNTGPLSENCRQAREIADSNVRTVTEILCDRETTYKDLFGSLYTQAKDLTGKGGSGSGEKEPKQPTSDNPPSTEPPSPAKVIKPKVHSSGKNHFPASNEAHGNNLVPGKAKGQKNAHTTMVASATAIRLAYYIGIRLDQLSPRQRNDLLSKLESLLRRRDVIAFLNAIQKGEGGGPTTVVGGLHGKSPKCQRLIQNLDLSAHPKEQGLPNRCFVRTPKYGLSTASGFYQIVHKNWKALRRLFGFKDFSKKNQAIAALELVRSSQVKGSRVGEGLVALSQGDVDNAIRKGTDPWASSINSRWHGKRTAPLLKYARQEFKKLGDEKHARHEIESFRHDTNS